MKAQHSRLGSITSAAVVGIAAMFIAVTAFTSGTPRLPENRVHHDALPDSPPPTRVVVPSAQSEQMEVERVTMFPTASSLKR
jgi:hypothetical protein